MSEAWDPEEYRRVCEDYEEYEGRGPKLRTEAERIECMKKAMGETAAAMLDARAERFLKWLAGWDEDTVTAAEDLFIKIEFCGAHPGATESDFYII